MDNRTIESCIAACKKCVDTCETCSTENKGKAGMENSVILCLACKDVCNELITASENSATNLDALITKCEAACIACATECAKHTDMHNCIKCADACNKCAAECKFLLAVAV